MKEINDPIAESIDDLAWVFRLVRFALNAIRRRLALAIAVWLCTTVAAVGAFVLMPKTYKVETRLLTHESALIPALVSPNRAVPSGAMDPTKNAVEIIKARENMSGIIVEAGLLERWDETRSIPGKFKDKLREAVLGKMNETDFRDAVIEIVDVNLDARVEGNVVVIETMWHTAIDAVNIAEAAQKRFLRTKKESELAEVSETVKILRRNLEDSQNNLEDLTRNVSALIQSKTGTKATPTRTVRVRRSVSTDSSGKLNDQKRRLKRALKDTDASIAALEREYERKVKEANERLNRVKKSLGRYHPDLQAAERAVKEASRPPPELGFLKREQAEMKAELDRLDRMMAQEAVKSGEAFQTIEVPVTESGSGGFDPKIMADPEIERAMTELQLQIGRHTDLAERLAEAETEVQAAGAAFEFRYQVTVPPLVPSKHIKPKAPIVIGGGFAAGIALAFLLCILLDLMSRRVLEPWQVEAMAGVPVLGVVDLDETPRLTGGIG